MSPAQDLVLLTAQFPFGNKAETFLETEIEVLSERFERVFVLPSHRRGPPRPLPDNITVVEMPWLEATTSSERRRALVSGAALRVALTTARAPRNWLSYAGSARMYLHILGENILKSRQLEAFVLEHGLSQAVFYDYWFENTTVALALLRRAGLVSTAVSRAHGFDVYDERWDGRPVPFREFKASGLDAVFPVSEFGAGYLRKRCPSLAEKLRVARLGVRAQPEPGTAPADIPLLVTCGSLIPSKRIDLVPGVLAALDRPLEWVHLGDGPERARVEAAASGLPARVRWSLAGHIANPDVLKFYGSRFVSALLSVSLSEGIPVSMMEAMSFGVPVVAVGVCGIPEIVNEETGVLLPEDATVAQIGAGLTLALDRGRFDRAHIRSFFAENYEARVNYNAFVDVLMALNHPAPVSP